MSSNFQLEFVPLSEDPSMEWGQIAYVPWDSSTMGWGVAEYRLPSPRPQAGPAWLHGLERWVAAHRVRLVSCTVPGEDFMAQSHLSHLGFHFVDYALCVTLPNLRQASLPPLDEPLHLAQPEDRETILHIAESSFSFGRFHNDPLIPSARAGLRYRQWMERALDQPRPTTRVYVHRTGASVDGFLHAEVTDTTADLRLAAVRAPARSPVSGAVLYVSLMHEFKRAGVRRVTAKIGAGNTAVMNLYAAMGFRFSQPTLSYHWHAKAGSTL
jgi:hypothetical protein